MEAIQRLREPIFCFTSDIDWNHDNAIAAVLELFAKHGVKLTVFATHQTPIFSGYRNLQIGVHPNFLPGSSHGATVQEVLDHVFGLFPDAETYRSHSYYDSHQLSEEMSRRGVAYDANLSLYMQDDIRPLRHCHGAWRFPTFFDDNIHWFHGGAWRFDQLRDRLLTPGLKIFNFHPYPIALNIPTLDYYRSKRAYFKTLSQEDIRAHQYQGEEPRQFLEELLEYVGRNHPTFHLRDLHRSLTRDSESTPPGDIDGRPAMQRDYSTASLDQRKELVRQQYEQMDATNVYVTSRDFHLRELEIAAVSRHLALGKILDCGCGNGYTLLSLGKTFADCEMLGVDFSDNLIRGAETLREKLRPDLKSVPRFRREDILEFLRQCDERFDTIITERLVVNLPTEAMQQRVIEALIARLRPNGVYLMVEGSQQGFRALNQYRAVVGLAEIPDVYPGNESSRKLDEAWLANIVARTGVARIERTENFAFYNLASKVLHPLVVAPAEPKFSASINAHAASVQNALNTSGRALPDIGAGKLWVIRRDH
jgi:SAM-dependent methyltransferase